PYRPSATEVTAEAPDDADVPHVLAVGTSRRDAPTRRGITAMTHTITRMLDTHPAEVTLDKQLLADCLEACLECTQTCTACADACLSEEMVADLRRCIRLNLDCADVCEATARVLTR